jgi:hypothetical protein
MNFEVQMKELSERMMSREMRLTTAIVLFGEVDGDWPADASTPAVAARW